MNHPFKEAYRTHQFKEAFCLMYYESKEGKGFMVWNSRDGVTPFIVFEDGVEYHHEFWWNDRKVDPKIQPPQIMKYLLKQGQRIFRDVTPEEARDFAIKRIASFKGTEWEVPEGTDRYQELLDSLTKDFGKPGEPTMVKVKEAGVLP